jgi:hypothetical protein
LDSEVKELGRMVDHAGNGPKPVIAEIEQFRKKLLLRLPLLPGFILQSNRTREQLMTSPTETKSAVSAHASEILCSKCDHSNPAEAEVCLNCAGHLHVYCRHCGHQNFRGNSRCDECRTQLHLPWPARWKNARARKWTKIAEVVLLVLTVTLTYKGIIAVSEFELPQRPYTPPPIHVLKPDGTWYLQ